MVKTQYQQNFKAHSWDSAEI